MNLNYILLIVVLVLFDQSCQPKPEEIKENTVILNENFDSNKIGWVEEFTDAHDIEIKKGFLYINSHDTSASQTSNGPLEKSFLLNFPSGYEITSSISLLKHRRDAHFGIILGSGSLEYKFSVSDSGTAAVDEWDGNRRTEIRLFTHSLSEMDTSMKRVVFSIDVHFRNFEFYINEKLMGEDILKTKGWRDIRLFTTTKSSVAIDYLRIKKEE